MQLRERTGKLVERRSVHVEPRDAAGLARHYIKDLVYGANDGIITTFAVVTGVAGGALPYSAVLIVGAANLAADGLSMAVGNFLSIRANEGARAADNLPEEEASPWKHAVATFVGFVVAGSVPLAPYVFQTWRSNGLAWSAVTSLAALFAVGAASTSVTVGRWWAEGLQMLLLGLTVGAVAYGAGGLIASIVS